jgi:hypothetical protein
MGGARHAWWPQPRAAFRWPHGAGGVRPLHAAPACRGIHRSRRMATHTGGTQTRGAAAAAWCACSAPPARGGLWGQAMGRGACVTAPSGVRLDPWRARGAPPALAELPARPPPALMGCFARFAHPPACWRRRAPPCQSQMPLPERARARCRLQCTARRLGSGRGGKAVPRPRPRASGSAPPWRASPPLSASPFVVASWRRV